MMKHLATIEETSPTNRLITAIVSLNIPTTAMCLSTCAKKKKRKSFKKVVRVKMKRDDVFHVLRSDAQKEDAKKCFNIRNFYRETISGNGK